LNKSPNWALFVFSGCYQKSQKEKFILLKNKLNISKGNEKILDENYLKRR
jgi:hypothetical protein